MGEFGSERSEARSSDPLREAVRNVRSAMADRDDVVVDLRDAERMRLELIAQELRTVIDSIPVDDQRFDFVINSGLQPRLWIDSASHIAMGRDRRTYRFVRDTRVGRVVLAESANLKPVAEQVTRYIAERIVERDRMVVGDVSSASERLVYEVPASWERRAPREWSMLLIGAGLMGAGFLFGLGMMVVAFWLRGGFTNLPG